MNDLEKFTKAIVEFRDQRDWKQFHNPKDVSLSLMLEAAELVEHFQWKNKEEIEHYVKTSKNKVAEEMVDVLYWILLLAHDLNINLSKAFEAKMRQNRKKYPVKKSKGNHKKYTELAGSGI